MAAALIANTKVAGATPEIGARVAAYTATKVTQNDWVILSDFKEVLEAVVYTVSTGARTAEAFTIDGTTKNKIVLTSATTGSVSILAIGIS
jgi:hypothetical protein